MRLRTQSLVDSVEGRDAWLRGGMEAGVNEGYATLDALLADGAVRPPAGRRLQAGFRPRLTTGTRRARHPRDAGAGPTGRRAGVQKVG